jgi:16S rRNA (guanine966-N2)-methyltransferase
VIAGSARGARLVGPGEGTRPLGDRVKQSVFAILEPRIRDRPFLDLYAGSGAAGIEALSRGASRAVFVEADRDAVRAIERNLAATGLRERAAIARASVDPWLRKRAAAGSEASGQPRREPALEPFAAAFADPPYDAPIELERTLRRIAEAGPGTILATDGVIVAKHFWRQAPAGNRLLASFRDERFGETMLTFYRWADGVPAQGEAS